MVLLSPGRFSLQSSSLSLSLSVFPLSTCQDALQGDLSITGVAVTRTQTRRRGIVYIFARVSENVSDT